MIQIVQDSAEHHFLTLLEKIKQDPASWVGIHCAFSRRIEHDALVADLSALPGKLESIREESAQLMVELARKADAMDDAILYHFADHDLLLVARPRSEAGHDVFLTLFKNVSASVKTGLVDFINFSREILSGQKLADRKLLAKKRMAAYTALADGNSISSIGIRRQRRENAVILIVEDDRFTATYTTSILSKNYDLVHARSGEDAVLDYIEHAPDIVFLDIHLPGLNGLETLHAIRQADHEAYVVMVSVDTAKTNVMLATKHGAAGFLKKPFSKDRILALVEKSPFVKGPKSIVNRA